MDQIVFGSITVEQLLIYGAATLVGLYLLRIVVRAIFGKPKDTYSIPGHCGHCKWSGRVSKYKAVCPKCGGNVRTTGPM